MTEIALLGVKGGPAIRPGSPMPTSHLLQMDGHVVVIDCGLGVSQGVIGQGVALDMIELIVITHLHSDHYLELGPLLHTAWTAGLKRPVMVVGPAGLARYFEGFFASMAEDIDLRIEDEGRPDLRDLIDLRLLAEGDVDTGTSLNISAMRNEHPPIDESYALRVEGAVHSVVFSGDTAAIPSMVDFARDADILVHEAMLTAGVDALCARVGNGDDRLKKHLLRSHTPAAEAGRIANAANVKVLALNHLVPSDDPEFTKEHWLAELEGTFRGTVRIGRDGMVISL
ncbi:Ribonuclease BN, tRNA processing enzyme [Aliiroseovarius halocynthiae]|uniref:MBL fold metallo-hydrolase n=1 Tax=Aliiroseovarius halocynthiae TaxID=985055 RepID=UPI00163D5498|nr:MBL fold metallo-hydrolase [Aliiroseovarius halocynthiae]SMR82310.1 Ribonuclease BN, tRNA processing enzyme [Aliiroseovarius halocynthiae]